ncbi:hypothetical protein BD626DRAFT_570435 [Schizophyllum amplum]|uniref:Uncharacterized protein n=1 Tax=Schizophyllum amplum TaxID=97359 RepID=A0A550CA96_9AGAR|nr:hypothetical protein BD626DRAFT_570435 [Auriculariopsis ampla]
MQSIVSNLPENPATGEVDMSSIMDYMSEHPDAMEKLAKNMSKLEANTSVDLETFNYVSLKSTIRKRSFWVLQLHSGPVVSPSEPHKALSHSEASRVPGAKPTFSIYCYDDKGIFRSTEDFIGLPTSKQVLESIKKSIAQPMPPSKPALPEFYLVSSKLEPHAAVISPFLDSIAPPISWRFETDDEANDVSNGVYQKNVDSPQINLKLAEEMKARGNAAYANKDKDAAVAEYTAAIKRLCDAMASQPDDADEKSIRRRLAVCYANRAAALLISGSESELKKALADGEAAVDWDATYAKGYVRQSTAQDLLGDKEKAMDIIAKGLRQPSLANEVGLADRLIELQTNGQGFSSDEAVFKNWLLDAMINDRLSSERLKNFGVNAWRKRVDEHMAQWKK